MRVQGNIIPESITVEPYMPMDGYAEVRLRENVQHIITHDELTGADIGLYEYDEYIIHAKARDGLFDEIRDNLDEWLATGRTVEINENASLVRMGKEKSDRILTEAVQLAQALTAEPSATVGVLIDGIPDWQPGKTYEKQYTLFAYDGKVGFTRQAGITAQEIYSPFSLGTEALYGVRPVPDERGIYPYIYNMAASVGMKVSDGDAVYECIQGIDPLLSPPGSLPAHFRKEEDYDLETE